MTQAVSATADAEVQTGQEHQQPEGGEHQTTGDELNGEEAAAGGAEGAAGAEDDEVVVTIAGASPTPEEEERTLPEWVKELRKANNQKAYELRQLKDKLARFEQAGSGAAFDKPLGEEPTLESCNFQADTFKRDWTEWNRRKQELEVQQAKRADETKRQQEAWNAKLVSYTEGKKGLKVKDYDDAEEAVKAATSVVQQGVILKGADNANLVVYALGKNPAKLKELAAITDPVQFAFAVAKLETQLKVTPKKSTPAPERVVRSSVAGAAAVDNTLEKLREEAARTGDMSKVVAYNRQKRAGRG
jgi:hypothetical protein